MTAGQLLERVQQFRHRHQGLQVHRVGVGWYQVACRPVVAVRGDAVSGEVEQHPVVGLDAPEHRFADQRTHRVAAGVQQRRLHVEVLLPGQHLREFTRVVDRGLQRRHLLVGIYADDEGMVLLERQRRLIVARRDVVHVVCVHPRTMRTWKSLANHSFVWTTLRDGWMLSDPLVAPYSSRIVSGGCINKKSSTFSVATSNLKRSVDSSAGDPREESGHPDPRPTRSPSCRPAASDQWAGCKCRRARRSRPAP